MSKIKVFVRVRPPLPGEFDQPNVFNCVEMEDFSCNWIKIKKDGEAMRYFARCWGPSSTQDEVYRVVGVPTVNDVFDGYFGTVFVYGQTGTGKTFTLGCATPGLEGILPRAIQHMFEKRAKEADRYDVVVTMQYVQLYRDSVQDLLDITKDNLSLRVEAQGAVIDQVTTRTIESYAQGLALVKEGDGNRAVANTKMNSASSRSHACLITNIRRTHKESGAVTNGKLYLIDLAGSERVSKSGVTGDAYKEAVAINKSLTVLGNCIASIVNGDKVVAFRDSTLTRLLQHSLLGNGRTSVIVTIRPDSPNMQETVCTLKFGERAQKVEAQMTPESYRDQVAEHMNKVSDEQQLVADYVATAEKYRLEAQEMRLQCAQKDAELKETEEDAARQVADAEAEIEQIRSDLEKEHVQLVQQIETASAAEIAALKTQNASVLEEIEIKVGVAVGRVTKELEVLRKTNDDTIASLEAAKTESESTLSTYAEQEGESVATTLNKARASIEQKIDETKALLRGCKPSPNEGASKQELEEKRDLLGEIFVRVSERRAELLDFMEDWRHDVIRRDVPAPSDEDITAYLKDAPPEAASTSDGSTAPPTSDDDDDDDDDSTSSSSSSASSQSDTQSKEVKEEDEPPERRYFEQSCKKEKSMLELVENIISYLSFGTKVNRLTDPSGVIEPVFMFLAKDAKSDGRHICFCRFDAAGKPEREVQYEIIKAISIKDIVLGQSSNKFRALIGERPTYGREAVMPADSSGVRESNVEFYVYRSFSLNVESKPSIDIVCQTDSDFEAWIVAMHRLSHQVPRWGTPMDLQRVQYSNMLTAEERQFCSQYHILPQNFIRVLDTMQPDQRLFMTLYDVRTVSQLDLVHASELYTYLQNCGYIKDVCFTHNKVLHARWVAKRAEEDAAARREKEVQARAEKEKLRNRIRFMYKKYRIAPEDGRLRDAFQAYNGNEEYLIKQLVKKYGREPSRAERERFTQELHPVDWAMYQRACLCECVRRCLETGGEFCHGLLPFASHTEETVSRILKQIGGEDAVPMETDAVVVSYDCGDARCYETASDDGAGKKICAAFVDIVTHSLGGMLALASGMAVPDTIDGVLPHLDERTKQAALDAVRALCHNVVTNSITHIFEAIRKRPWFIGTVEVNKATRHVSPLLLHSAALYGPVLSILHEAIEDMDAQVMHDLADARVALEKKNSKKKSSGAVDLGQAVSSIRVLELVLLPWLRDAYPKAQETYLSKATGPSVETVFSKATFKGGDALGPGQFRAPSSK
eukprot:PhM_4_TR1287/c0_g1_i3/m.65139/K10396/KIF5; kinesin family member 5